MARNQSQLERPLGRRSFFRMPYLSQETVGRISERFARAMGTGAFLIAMTVFVALWLTWNTLAPTGAQFDPRALNFTLLTLILSLRDKFEVSTTITEDELRELVMNSDAVKRALEGKEAKNIIVRAPKLVNISTK